MSCAICAASTFGARDRTTCKRQTRRRSRIVRESRNVADHASAKLGAWTGSWTASPDNSSAASAISAVPCDIGAASACEAGERAPRNAPLARFSTGGCASFWPGTSAPRRCQSSLGYEPHDDRLRCLAPSLVTPLTSVDMRREVVPAFCISRVSACPASSGLQIGLQNGFMTCGFLNLHGREHARSWGDSSCCLLLSGCAAVLGRCIGSLLVLLTDAARSAVPTRRPSASGRASPKS
jgi:hypothetical protein